MYRRNEVTPPSCFRCIASHDGQAADIGSIGENARQRSRSMGTHRIRILWGALLAMVIGLWGAAAPVQAYDNPELLPDHPTPVIDLARVFSETQRERLEESLGEVEERTGWKLRVLTQYERTPGLAIREFWGLDERSLLLVADPRGGNLLNFNVGDAYLTDLLSVQSF